ncbi:hypothetical protein ACWGLF_43075 [Streptomyces puniciscabiei]
MQPLPVPCPAHLIPDATGTDAFHDAYRNAMAQHVVFVAIEFERRQRWTVKADTLTAGPDHTVADAINEELRTAITRLVHNHEVDLDAYTGPVYFMMHGVRSEERARELAAALHAASTATWNLWPAPSLLHPDWHAPNEADTSASPTAGRPRLRNRLSLRERTRAPCLPFRDGLVAAGQGPGAGDRTPGAGRLPG